MQNNKSGGVKNNVNVFIAEVARYFRDFLETNFHKRRMPKRSIKYRNDKNLLLGLRLSKYPRISKKFWKIINDNAFKSGIISIKRDELSKKWQLQQKAKIK